jgi:hypothetical protein
MKPAAPADFTTSEQTSQEALHTSRVIPWRHRTSAVADVRIL